MLAAVAGLPREVRRLDAPALDERFKAVVGMCSMLHIRREQDGCQSGVVLSALLQRTILRNSITLL